MPRGVPVVLEKLLLAIGCGGVIAVAGSLLPNVLAAHRPAPGVTKAVVEPSPATNADPNAVPGAASGQWVGELRVPALGLRTPVLEDCTPQNLEKGSCHIKGTARIGGLGTAAIAGHRDASFRVLQDVKTGTSIAIDTPDGTYLYSVDQTRIVTPEDVSVLSTLDRPGLVLVTCYPFHYIGAAPKRFIVEAHLISAAPVG